MPTAEAGRLFPEAGRLWRNVNITERYLVCSEGLFLEMTPQKPLDYWGMYVCVYVRMCVCVGRAFVIEMCEQNGASVTREG